jgi:Mg2+ and Co2+ transporter CorA
MGMNSWVPFEGNEAGFFLVIAVMASVLFGLIAYFRRQRWR